jgi:DNA primase
MSRISAESVDALRDAVDMVDLVSGRTQLRRSGARHVGRCPFHEERTPSFSVDPLKKLYYCFGCGAGGDAIKFVEDTENLDYPGAVEWLAERYGVELDYERGSADDERRRARRARLLRLLEEAADFYSRYLWAAAEAQPARAYLDERGIRRETAGAFRLGFAPAAWDRVSAAARSKGYTADELNAAGLAARGRRGPVDRFRGRLMFPLADARGRVVGFGARQMPGGEPPKYLNSPEGELFRKGGLVYGLDRGRRAIATAGRGVIVEGYTDVLALHQAGMPTAVASMGTALTEEQVRELRRVCETVVLAFDADSAGAEATLRGMALARAQGLEVLVATLPKGQDPADVARGGAGAMEAVLDGAESYLGHRVGVALAAGGSRDRVYERVRTILSQAPPSPERETQVARVADRLSLTGDLAASLTARAAADGRRGQALPRRRRRSPRERDERLFLALCLAHPEEGSRLLSELDVAHFSGTSHWEAATYIGRRLAGGGTPEEGQTWAPYIAELNALAAQEGASEAALSELFLKLQLHRAEMELKTLGKRADLSLSELRRLQQLQAFRLSTLEAIRAHAPED